MAHLKGLARILILLSAAALNVLVAGENTDNVFSQYRFSHITSLNGLPASGITNCFQDSTGIIWLTSNDGLLRYDGNQFRTIRSGPNGVLNSNKITDVLEDRDGGLWVSAVGGVSYFAADGNDRRYGGVGGKEGAQIWVNSLHEDNKGRIWAGQNNGLFKFMPDKGFQRVKISDSEVNVISITQVEGELFLATAKGLLAFDLDNKVTRVVSETPMLVGHAKEDEQALWYSGYYGGLYRYDIGLKQFQQKTLVGFSSVWIRNITYYSGHLYLATLKNGIIKYHPENNTTTNIRHRPTVSHSLLSNQVLHVMFDQSGVMWASGPKGVSLYSPLKQGSRVSLNNQVLSADSKIYGTAKISDNQVMLAAETGTAIFSIADGTLTNSNIDLPMTNTIYAISNDNNDNFWIAHDRGLSVYNYNQGTIKHFSNAANNPHGLTSSAIYTVLPVSSEKVWITGQLGVPVALFDINQGVVRTILNSADNPYRKQKAYTYTSLIDNKQNLWLATNIGLIRIGLLDNSSQFFSSDDRSFGGEFNDLAMDSVGQLWAVSSSTGLFKVVEVEDNEDYQLVFAGAFKSKNSRGFTNVVAMDQTLWLTNHNELFAFQQKTETLERYPNLLGEIVASFVPASINVVNNTILVGSNNGLFSFDPSVIKNNAFKPNVVLTRIRSGGINLSHLIETDKRTLPFEYNNLEFTFASLDYNNSRNNNFRYRLEGFESGWGEGKNSRVRYTNLPWGSYRLVVEGSNSDGVWSDKQVSFEFTIRPAWWFYVIVGLLVSLALLMIMYLLTRRKRLLQLQREARYDYLTGLPNRLSFNLHLDQLIEKQTQFALVLIDINDFKHVNDLNGHVFGDGLLQSFAQRLLLFEAVTSFVARLGGDEFVLILPTHQYSGRKQLILKIDECIGLLQKPYRIEGEAVDVSVNAGLSMYSEHGNKVGELLKSADLALSDCKNSLNDGVCCFQFEMNKIHEERLKIRSLLKNALSSRQFSLVFQPKWYIDSQRITGAEVLIRWIHPTSGTISPAKFIPEAENTGDIIEIGAWVISESCRVAAQWINLGILEGIVSVNVSAMQLKHGALIGSVKRALAETNLPPDKLEIEITESIFIDNLSEMRSMLFELRELGVRIALDDFGTGYSALSYLTQLPIDTLKIDRSFLSNLDRNPSKTKVLLAIVEVAVQLDVNVVIEGIETWEQINLLKVYSSVLGQGYLISEPLDMLSFEQLLVRQQQLPNDRSNLAP